jgi:hypothetical protein
MSTPTTPTTPTTSTNIYKLLGGIGVTIFMVAGAPLLVTRAGLMTPLPPHAWFILFVTGAGLVVKAVFGDVAAGEFLFYKFGYDNCVMAFGATLTALALQVESKDDLFPGIDPMFHALGDPFVNRSAEILIFLIVALVATVLTGRIASAIKNEKARGANVLSLFNTFVGVGLLGIYVIMLVSRG